MKMQMMVAMSMICAAMLMVMMILVMRRMTRMMMTAMMKMMIMMMIMMMTMMVMTVITSMVVIRSSSSCEPGRSYATCQGERDTRWTIPLRQLPAAQDISCYRVQISVQLALRDTLNGRKL